MGIEESKITLLGNSKPGDETDDWISVWVRRDDIRIVNYRSSEFINMEKWCRENCKTYLFSQLSFDGSVTFLIFRFSTEYGEDLAKEEAAWFKMTWQ